jgi:hypothetical protein
MSDKKILSINMDEFSYSNNKTKKTQPKQKPQDKIRVKNPANKKQQTLRKQSLLNMIRKQQEDRYKRLYSNNQQSTQSNQPSSQIQNNNVDKFNSDFDNSSRAYLDRQIKKHEMNVPKNTTLKRYPSNEQHITQQPTVHTTNTTPKYGCLKNGNLPTYRNYLNKTQHNRPSIQVGSNTSLNSNIPNVTNNTITPQQSPVSIYEKNENNPPSILESQINDGMKKMSELKQRNDILSKLSNKRPKTLKRKKTLRRTYKVGRSSVAPKVSVLVSNKTLRNRVSTQKQLLKQTPIQDVKKYLIKHGLIRVGSTTPNDVLRKMYESLSLVCGEIHNHNPDTLLYNYINGNE